MNRYAIENEKGHPGMKGDTAVDVCDSFASEGGSMRFEEFFRTNSAERILRPYR